jgi:hypothetical protein
MRGRNIYLHLGLQGNGCKFVFKDKLYGSSLIFINLQREHFGSLTKRKVESPDKVKFKG